MKQKLLLLSLLLLGVLLPQQVSADDFMQKASNYTAMIAGIDKIQFTLPTQFDGNLNEGISAGHVYVTVDDGPRLGLFFWSCANYRNLTSDDESGTIYARAFQDGTLRSKAR